MAIRTAIVDDEPLARSNRRCRPNHYRWSIDGMSIAQRMRNSGTYVLFVIICVTFGIIAPNFATSTNLRLVLIEIAPVVISGAALELLVASQVPTPAAATTTTAAPMMDPLRANHFFLSFAICASLADRPRPTRWGPLRDGRPQWPTGGGSNHPIGRTYTPVNNHL